MRKIIFLMHVSLDGYVTDANGSMDWVVYNKDIEQYSHSLHSTTDTAIYGRVTYQMMAAYWPTVLQDPDADAGALDHARWVDTATKIVFSKTLDSVTWNNTLLIRGNIKEEMTKLKQQPGKNMWLLGSPTLAKTFMKLDLIDEYRLNINPVILGGGTPLYENSADSMNLKLLEAQTFEGGVVGLRYEPIRS